MQRQHLMLAPFRQSRPRASGAVAFLLTAMLIATPTRAQEVTLAGEATNRGTIVRQHSGITGSIRLRAGPTAQDPVTLAISPPLGGSGRAELYCWADTVLIATGSATGDTIAWLGRREAPVGGTIAGRYLILGGPFRDQGGTWWLRAGNGPVPDIRQFCRARPPSSTVDFVRARSEAFTDAPLGGPAPRPEERPRDPTKPTPLEAEQMASALESLRLEMANALPPDLMNRLWRRAVAEGASTGDEAQRFGQRFGVVGVLRLSPEVQFERLRDLADVVLGLSPAACERWASLAPQFRAGYLISRMTPRQRAVHVSWQLRVVRAELDAERPPASQSKEVEWQSLARIAANLGPGDGEFLLEALDTYDDLGAVARCRAESAMLVGILKETTPQRGQLAVTYHLWVTRSAATVEPATF